MNEEIKKLTEQYNTLKAQSTALTHALASLISVLPTEMSDAIEEEYDIRCSTFQTVVNDGRTELDELAIQREQFSAIRKRIFHL